MDLFSHYKYIRLATKKDSKKIERFFNSSSMITRKSTLTYIREPDFFEFLYYQSKEVFVFCSENDQGELRGVGSLTIREGYVKGELVRIGYLSDLRVNAGLVDREFMREWKRFYSDLVLKKKEIKEFNCDFLITAIMADNNRAKNSLVKNKSNAFEYIKICDYKMINILTSFTKLNKDKKIFAKRCQSREEVLNYLEQKNIVRELGFTRSFFENAIDNWPGLSVENFIKIEREDKIIGMCATWNPSASKKIQCNYFPFKLKLMNLFASLFTKTPSAGSELQIQYLNFLTLEDKDALGSIIDLVKTEGIFNKYHLLAYADYNHCSYNLKGKGILWDETNLELYQVVTKNSEESLLELTGIPGFEISLV